MRSHWKFFLIANIVFAQLSFCFCFNLTTQNDSLLASGAIAYLSPVPNSKHNPVNSSVIIRLNSEEVITETKVNIYGSISGTIKVLQKLSSDGKTIIVKPNFQFAFGEMVQVEILNTSNSAVYLYSFFIEKEDLQQQSLLKTLKINYESNRINEVNSLTKVPKLITKIYNSSAIDKGKLFLSAYGVINQTFQSNPSINSSILIAENDGTLFYSKDIGSNKGAGLTDFKMHSNGLMSYPKVLKNYLWTGGAEVIHMVMDKSFAVVDSFQMGNGYNAETHDFQMLPNGHTLLMAYYLVPIDLSKVVPGSHPNSYIDGAVVQELDAQKNVVFQWRTWDYLSTNNIPWHLVTGTTQQIINVFHLNSIRLDNDGNLLLGTVSNGLKVNRQTGKVMWIIGGYMNQFTFSNVVPTEAIGDFGGHTFQRLANGNILVLDNSPFPWQQGFGQISSEVVEYKIDEEKKTAELVWKYKPDNVISGWHAGSAQRLSNGNTLICWGGPPYENGNSIPIVTEVTQAGEKVFELFYDGTEQESYRAFRFILENDKPITQVTKELLLAPNTYDFKKSETEDTGISLKINSMESVGYNMATVKRMLSSPAEPKFNGKSPIILNGRIVVTSYGLSNLDASLRFDVKSWGIQDPANTKIFFRSVEGKGTFIPLETTYNFVTGKINASVKELGEFVLGKEDMKSISYAPIPNSPSNNSSVNYKIPVPISWSPVGFASKYALQIATDESFQKIVVDEKSLSNSLYKFISTIAKAKYYWRAKTITYSGEGEWCATQTFNAVEPFITIKKPNGNERWHIGLDHYIQWDKNILDSANVFLIRKNEVVKKLTKTTNPFYLWEIDLKSMLANDYRIKIVSSADTSIYDYSDSPFSIVDTITSVNKNLTLPDSYSLYQNYPNPFNATTTIRFDLPGSSYTSLIIYNSIGQVVSELVNEDLTKGSYSISWNCLMQPSGIYYYRLKSGSYSETKKLVLLK